MCIRTQEDNAGRETMNIGSIFLLVMGVSLVENAIKTSRESAPDN